MVFSSDKSRLMLFGTGPSGEDMEEAQSKDSPWEHPYRLGAPNEKVMMGNRELWYVAGFKYLGVILDPRLDFSAHARYTLERCEKRFAAVRRLAAASWGALSRHVRMLFSALVVSVLRYCAGVWMSCRKSLVKEQDVLIRGARSILGVGAKSHGLGSLRVAGLPTAAGIRDECAAWAVARLVHRRTEGPEPLFEALVAGSHPAWMALGLSRLRAAGVPVSKIEPKSFGKNRITPGFAESLAKERLRVVCTPASAEELQSYHASADWVAYTDGSVRGFRGASAAAVYEGKGQYGPPVSVGWRSERWSDSFGSEQEGLFRIVKAFRDLNLQGEIVLLTDSLSNLLSILSPLARDGWEVGLRSLLVEMTTTQPSATITLHFVRGHAGTAGNEIADARCSSITASGDGFLDSHDMEIPLHIAKSRVAAAALQAQINEIRDKGGFTAEHLYRVNRFGGNPLFQPGGSSIDRSKDADRAFNKMLLGGAPFEAFEPDGDRVCAACGRTVSRRGAVEHVLFHCPALQEARSRLELEFSQEMVAREARNREAREAGGDMVGRGREIVLEWGDVGMLVACPALVMQAIQEVADGVLHAKH